MKLKKYQVNFISQGKLTFEIFEAVSRKAALNCAESVGITPLTKKSKKKK